VLLLRWGRRKPYVTVLTPVLVLAIAMLYNPSLAAGGIGPWFAVFYFLMQVRHRPVSPYLSGISCL
jgi:Na+/melibiose symporter-like transporter